MRLLSPPSWSQILFFSFLVPSDPGQPAPFLWHNMVSGRLTVLHLVVSRLHPPLQRIKTIRSEVDRGSSTRTINTQSKS